MKYKVRIKNAVAQFIEAEFNVEAPSGDDAVFQLPVWRPGRYELAAYARNVRSFLPESEKGGRLKYEKVSTNKWKVFHTGQKFRVRYEYFCGTMDAGSSWVDEETLYLNFINCLMYESSHESDPCEIELEIPDDWQIACGMPADGNILKAKDYYQVADSPVIAARHIHHHQFKVRGLDMHLWIKGDIDPDWQRLEKEFSAFTEVQINTMPDFPEKDYHFLFHILPYRHYHGVEHRNSTVITLGPASEFYSDKIYNNFLGVSSHELFHSWNIIRIRPEEMMPYDFTRENFFTTGFVAEGFTTYYGDLFLIRSGVFDTRQYLEELNMMFQRHFKNYGRFTYSLTESSQDLWLHGYQKSLPHSKVSIYVKGAITALMMDLEIRRATGGEKSLDDVMRYLYEEYGKKDRGYLAEDICSVADKVSGSSFLSFFEKYIFGTTPVEEDLGDLLSTAGFKLEECFPAEVNEKVFGFRVRDENGDIVITETAPDTPAERLLAPGDKIIAVDGVKAEASVSTLLEGKKSSDLLVSRHHKVVQVQLPSSEQLCYKYYKVKEVDAPSDEQRKRRSEWLGI